MAFSSRVLDVDAEAVATDIAKALSRQVLETLRRKGVVVGLSGGIDSSLVTALAARAVGPDRVVALLMPEIDSSPASLELGQIVARRLGVRTIIENLAPALDAIGCYTRQQQAIRTVFPDYGPGWACKLSLPSILEGDRVSISQLTVRLPDRSERTSRLSPEAYRELVAATNFKQRFRKVTEYFHADCLGYVVAGTPNRLEYDQGFFVKQGDGAADVKPIAHLYKTQVYALARHLGVPEEVCSRPPTTDTFSMAQTQEEFYFALPYDKMDLCLYAHNHHVSADEVAPVVGITAEQVSRVFRDIEAKRRTTKYLHAAPLLVRDVEEL